MAGQTVSNKSIKFNTKLLNGENVNNIKLTIKTYRTRLGLATKIHRTSIDKESFQGENQFST